MKLNIRDIIIVALLVILAFAIRTCSKNKDTAINWKGMYDYQTQVTDSFKNAKGLQVVEQKPAIFTDDAALKAASKDLFDLKKKDEKHVKEISALVSANQKLSIKNKVIPFDTNSVTTKAEDYFPKDTPLNKDSVIIPPKPFHESDSNFSIAGKVLLKGVQIDSLIVFNKLSFRIIESKKGLFKSRETLVQAINSNPFITNSSLQSMVVKNKVTSWNKWIKPVVVALAAGFATYKAIK